MADTTVIGVGNPRRGDDGAGPRIVELIRARLPDGVTALACSGEPWALIEAWEGAGLAVVVDAVVSGSAPGTVHRVDPATEPVPSQAGLASTHGLGVAEAIQLAAALGRLPERLVLYGVEAASCAEGAGLSPQVEGALAEVAGRMLEELRA